MGTPESIIMKKTKKLVHTHNVILCISLCNVLSYDVFSILT